MSPGTPGTPPMSPGTPGTPPMSPGTPGTPPVASFNPFVRAFFASLFALSSSLPKPASLIAPSISPAALLTSPIAVVFFEIIFFNSSSESYSFSPTASLPGIFLISGTCNILSMSKK